MGKLFLYKDAEILSYFWVYQKQFKIVDCLRLKNTQTFGLIFQFLAIQL